MRPLFAFSIPQADLKAGYLDPVAKLGALDVRYLEGPDGNMEKLVYSVRVDIPKTQLADLVRVARKACAPVPCSVSGVDDEGNGRELWAADLAARLAKVNTTIATHWGVPADTVADL